MTDTREREASGGVDSEAWEVVTQMAGGANVGPRFLSLARLVVELGERLTELENGASEAGWVSFGWVHPTTRTPGIGADMEQADGERVAERFDAAWEFLCGAGPDADGQWFGEGPTPYWWRPALRPLMAEVAAALRSSAQKDGEQEAFRAGFKAGEDAASHWPLVLAKSFAVESNAWDDYARQPSPAPVTPEERGHVWGRWLEGSTWDSCRFCGIVRRRDGKNKPCRGVVSVSLRSEGEGEHRPVCDGYGPLLSCPICAPELQPKGIDVVQPAPEERVERVEGAAYRKSERVWNFVERGLPCANWPRATLLIHAGTESREAPALKGWGIPTAEGTDNAQSVQPAPSPEQPAQPVAQEGKEADEGVDAVDLLDELCEAVRMRDYGSSDMKGYDRVVAAHQAILDRLRAVALRSAQPAQPVAWMVEFRDDDDGSTWKVSGVHCTREAASEDKSDCLTGGWRARTIPLYRTAPPAPSELDEGA